MRSGRLLVLRLLRPASDPALARGAAGATGDDELVGLEVVENSTAFHCRGNVDVMVRARVRDVVVVEITALRYCSLAGDDCWALTAFFRRQRLLAARLEL